MKDRDVILQCLRLPKKKNLRLSENKFTRFCYEGCMVGGMGWWSRLVLFQTEVRPSW